VRGRHEHHRAAASRGLHGARGAHAGVGDAAQVDGEDALPVFVTRVEERAERARCGIGNKHVKPPEGVKGLLHGPSQSRGGHVAAGADAGRPRFRVASARLEIVLGMVERATRPPSEAMRRAVARPMPSAPPVIRTALFSKRVMTLWFVTKPGRSCRASHASAQFSQAKKVRSAEHG
jgi:hypothetical protein